MHPAYTIADTADWLGARDAEWDAGKDFSMLVVDAATGEVLGASGLNQINVAQRFANLGYWVRASRSRQRNRLGGRAPRRAVGLRRRGVRSRGNRRDARATTGVAAPPRRPARASSATRGTGCCCTAGGTKPPMYSFVPGDFA